MSIHDDGENDADGLRDMCWWGFATGDGDNGEYDVSHQEELYLRCLYHPRSPQREKRGFNRRSTVQHWELLDRDGNVVGLHTSGKGSHNFGRKSRRKDKNKDQKETLRRIWQRGLDAINRKGCAIEYAQEIEEEDRYQALLIEEDLDNQKWILRHRAFFILGERFDPWKYDRAEDLLAMTADKYNKSYEREYAARYVAHLDKLARKRIAEEERKLDEADALLNAKVPESLPDDDLRFCEPPVEVKDGRVIIILHRDPDAQQRFGARLKARNRREANSRFWERTPESRPAKHSKFDESDAD